MALLDLRGSGQPVDPVRHQHVKDQQIDLMFLHVFDCVLRRPKSCEQFVAGRRPDVHFKETAGYILVVRNDDPNALGQTHAPPLPAENGCTYTP